MAIATGTAAVIAAGIAAGGTAYGAHKASQANSRAAAAQEHGTDAALAYQKSRDAEAKAERDRSWADYEKRYAEWQSRRPGGAASAAGGGAGAAMGGPSTGIPAGTSVFDLIRGMQPAGVGAGPDVSGGPAQGAVPAGPGGVPDVAQAGAAMPVEGASLADLAQWSDHRKYLGGAA